MLGALGSTSDNNFYMSTQIGSKLEILVDFLFTPLN